MRRSTRSSSRAAAPGGNCIAYALDCGDALGVRNMPAGSYDLVWHDPETGATVRQSGVSVEAGDGYWQAPPTFSGEAAVWIGRVGWAPPTISSATRGDGAELQK